MFGTSDNIYADILWVIPSPAVSIVAVFTVNLSYKFVSLSRIRALALVSGLLFKWFRRRPAVEDVEAVGVVSPAAGGRRSGVKPGILVAVRQHPHIGFPRSFEAGRVSPHMT